MFSTSWVLQYTEPDCEANLPESLHEVVVDTRKISAPHSLFVALKGPKFDGHDFVDRALEAGAVCLVNKTWEPERKGPFIRVEDTLDALQSLAAAWRSGFGIPVIGITGSNGKTIVKEMLSSILARRFTVWRSPGSFNSQVGVALSVLGLREGHQVAIIEAGISENGEMDRLEAMIRPTHGVLTSIGTAHAAGLKTKENTAKEKLKLFKRLSGVLVAPETPEVQAHNSSPRTLWFSPEIASELGVKPSCSYQPTSAHARLKLQDDSEFEVPINAAGAHNAMNALVAAMMALELGLTKDEIIGGLSAFGYAPMRLEIHTTSNWVTLINDAYSSDPVSARSALSTLSFYGANARKIAILGDMLDLGALSEDAHRELGRDIPGFGVDLLLTLGPLAKSIGSSAVQAGMPAPNVRSFDSIERLSEFLDGELESGDVVLFKGSQALELDRVASGLLESVAPTRLYVDLEAIRQNVQAIKTRIQGTRLMAVVKSFAYGNDATRVSQTLVREGIDALAVAYADEAIPLRNRGLNLPILVTNTLGGEADKIVKYDLMALVGSVQVLDDLERHASYRGKTVEVHLEVDTGMGRLGVKSKDVLEFAKEILKRPSLRLVGLMTHFASADMAQDDAYTTKQLALFDEAIAALKSAGIEPEWVHAANTAAAWRMPEARYNLVRVGLGLYGYHPSADVEEWAKDTAPALKFATQVIHVKDVEPGESISYGRTYIAESKRRIATIAAGYNDGFSRFMSNGGEVLIRGKRAQVVGNVCMDVSMVDVTEISGVEVGDEVVIFGTQDSAEISVDEIAHRGSTINYEVLCKISPRVRRIFIE